MQNILTHSKKVQQYNNLIKTFQGRRTGLKSGAAKLNGLIKAGRHKMDPPI